MKIPLHLQKIELPGLEMEIFIPDPEGIRAAWKEGLTGFPYWTKIWPSALSMSRFLLDHPEFIRGKSVLELAAGLGLPSLVAARIARSVISSDLYSEAVETIRKSAHHQHLHNMDCRVLDWKHIPEDLETDVLLLSDVNYDPVAFPELECTLQVFLDKGTTLILSTPQRLAGRDFLTPFLLYCRHRAEMEEGEVRTSVFVFKDTS